MDHKRNDLGIPLDTRAEVPGSTDLLVSNETVSNQSGERPWPAPSLDTGWWRGEGGAPAFPPPPVVLEPEIQGVRDEHAEPATHRSGDGFPLWPPQAAQAPATPHLPAHAGPAAAGPAPAEPVAAGSVATETAEDEAAEDEAVDEPDLAAVLLQPELPPTESWPAPQLKATLLARASTRTATSPVARGAARRRRGTRRPASGLSMLLLLALLAGFFAWTTAEPLWLAVGHARAGTATVTGCEGNGVLRRCVASFAGPGYTVRGVTLVGAAKAQGTSVAAQMVRRGGRIAYAGTAEALRVRWAVGLGLVVLCGVLIAWLTGALRLPTRRGRVTAVVVSLAAPLLLLAGMLVGTY